MLVKRKLIVIASVTLSLALLVSSCSDTKVSQCQRLIEVINEGNSQIEQNKGSQVTTSLKLAKELEETGKRIEGLGLKEPKLQELQTKFANGFKTSSQAIDKAAKALGKAKETETKTASGTAAFYEARGEIDTSLSKAISTFGKESDKLIGELNNYCKSAE